MFADSGRPNRSVSMIAANAAFDFGSTVPSSILTNLANDCVIVSEESAKYKTRQMLKTGQSPNILPAKFSHYTVHYLMLCNIHVYVPYKCHSPVLPTLQVTEMASFLPLMGAVLLIGLSNMAFSEPIVYFAMLLVYSAQQ